MSDVVKLITTIGIVGASDHPAKATAERELQSVRDELFDLRQRVAELEADKARLDWVETHNVFEASDGTDNREIDFLLLEGETLRDAIDAAMKTAMAQQKEGAK